MPTLPAERPDRRPAQHPGIASHPVERLIATGPMPLAQLARRARNAKTGAAILQNSAHYLGEASAALAASFWLARALQRDGECPRAPCRRQLSSVLGRGASFGTWVGLWREAAAQIGGDEQAALGQPLAEQGPLESLADALAADKAALGDDGVALHKALNQARKRGVLGFFDFLAMFRNKVYGHGTMLPEAACQRLAAPFLAAVVHVLDQDCIFQGAWLGRTAIDLLSEHQSRYWLRLSGVAGTAHGVDGRERDLPSADDYPPGTLYFVTSSGPLGLDFWVVQDEDATGLTRFGFFQRALGRRKTARGGGPQSNDASNGASNGASSAASVQYRGVEYLDYLGGRFSHDGQLESLRERAPVWLQVADEGSDPAAASARPTERSGQNPDEKRFGDFIIEGELGRGAMGIVYRATQVSLGRKVALKVLPPALLGDPIALGRFHREVQALGRCDHPNVVRVLSYGVEEGRPWFAMELVEGADLSEVFTTLSLWKGKTGELTAGHLSAASSASDGRRADKREHDRTVTGQATLPRVPVEPAQLPDPADLEGLDDDLGLYRRLARLFADAAAGVEEIHRRGVVHRDLKPANLMLSRTGDRLVVMDLGLAKMTDVSMSYTRQAGGDFVGSARYAAPEQLQAKLLAVDHRADVYSLGATLYELATLHALYPSNEIAELLQHKLTQDPAPARERERAIPRDLETILQKALARRPEDRYASAAELGEDLRAFAEHKPILARPPSAFEYLRLFYHRQRRLVHLGLTAMTALFVVIAVSFMLVAGERSRALTERDNAQRERDNAQRERERAESLASFILDDLYERLEPIGKLEFLRDVSERMVKYYKAREHDDLDETIRHARAILRTGEVEHKSGQTESAARHYREARDLLLGVSDQITRPDHPHHDDVMATRAHLQFNLAGVYINQNRLGEAFENAEDAREIRQVLFDKDRNRGDFQLALAQSHRQLGIVSEDRGRHRDALVSYLQAANMMQEAVLVDPDDLRAREELAQNRINVARNLRQMGDIKDAQDELKMALKSLQELSREAPLNMRVRRLTAACHVAIASLRLDAGDDQGALQSYEQARELRRTLAELEPDRTGWQRDLAASHGHSAEIKLREGNLDGALEFYDASLRILENRAAADRTDILSQMDAEVTRSKKGEALEMRGDLDGALEQYRRSLAVADEQVAKAPDNGKYQRRLGDYHGMIASVLDRQGRTGRAIAHLEQKREIFAELSRKDPRNSILQSDLVDVWHRMSTLQERMQQAERALTASREALAIHQKLLASAHDAPDSPTGRVRTRTGAGLHAQLARSHQWLGHNEEARQEYRNALARYHNLGDDDTDRAAVRELRANLKNLAGARPGQVVAPLGATIPVPVMTTPLLESRSPMNDMYE